MFSRPSDHTLRQDQALPRTDSLPTGDRDVCNSGILHNACTNRITGVRILHCLSDQGLLAPDFNNNAIACADAKHLLSEYKPVSICLRHCKPTAAHQKTITE